MAALARLEIAEDAGERSPMRRARATAGFRLFLIFAYLAVAAAHWFSSPWHSHISDPVAVSESGPAAERAGVASGSALDVGRDVAMGQRDSGALDPHPAFCGGHCDFWSAALISESRLSARVAAAGPRAPLPPGAKARGRTPGVHNPPPIAAV